MQIFRKTLSAIVPSFMGKPSVTQRPMHYSNSQVQSLVELQEAASQAIIDLCQHEEHIETLRREIHETFQNSVEKPHGSLCLMESFIGESSKLNPSDPFASFALKHILVHLLTNFNLELATSNAPRRRSDACINLQLRATEETTSPC
jgi:hypothetical protein